jgi:hypothetical protein
MSDWILVPCLAQLRNEFNQIASGRDKTTDGSVGDAAHAGTSSDHNPDETGHVPIRDADKVNEVHAIDVDKDLREADLTMEQVVQHLLWRCRTDQERRLRYIIYNRRIWSASDGWAPRNYSGSNPHTAHAHFSASYDTAREADTSSWHLEDLMALSDADKDWVRALFERTAQPDNGGVTSKIGRDALDQGIPNGVTGTKTTTWKAIQDLGTTLVALARQQGVSHEQLAAAIADVDEQVLAALPGRSAEEQAAAIEALLGPEQAAAVGRILAG